MSKKGWIIFAVIVVGILTGLVVTNNNSGLDVSKVNLDKVQVASAENGNIGDHVSGKIGSKVTLIEYGDYQCPACGQAEPIVKSVTDTYKDQLQYVFRNFPLTRIHPNAKAASGVAEAAGLQGKFWEMHDLLYKEQKQWSDLSDQARNDYFLGLAKKLNLDITRFKDDLVSSAVNDKITFDTALGTKAEVQGTPSIYLNGKLIKSSDWSDVKKLSDLVKTELLKNNIALPQ